MKSGSIMTKLLAAALVGGLYGSASAAPPPNPWGYIVTEAEGAVDPSREMSPPAPGSPGEMRVPNGKMPHPCCRECQKKLLDLTGEQKKRITALVEDERDEVSPLLKKEEELRRQLHRAERAASFDESGVRKVAASLAQIETDLIVIRARTQSKILSVLTPEQRRMTEKLELSKEPRPLPPPQGAVPGKKRAEQ
jgi:Spy/CpxP family protein refolding chaperone